MIRRMGALDNLDNFTIYMALACFSLLSTLCVINQYTSSTTVEYSNASAKFWLLHGRVGTSLLFFLKLEVMAKLLISNKAETGYK